MATIDFKHGQDAQWALVPDGPYLILQLRGSA